MAYLHDRAGMAHPDATPDSKGLLFSFGGTGWRLVRADDAAAGTEPHLES